MKRNLQKLKAQQLSKRELSLYNKNFLIFLIADDNLTILNRDLWLGNFNINN